VGAMIARPRAFRDRCQAILAVRRQDDACVHDPRVADGTKPGARVQFDMSPSAPSPASRLAVGGHAAARSAGRKHRP
jgi:hypothetical protein